MNKKNKTILSVIALVAVVAYLTVTGMGNSINEYVKITDLKNGGFDRKLINVNGTVVNDTINWDPGETELTFKMTDGQDTMDVYYKGNIPNSFAADIPVVVQGQYSDGLFTARNILVKCPSKYEADIQE
jgi:cytochrome c-type biogenesis protein CcmE